ncbi:hypothetical protein [Xanthomonas sp. GPE 39]|nr:hypothetical protein [Xanthomonas sp. GPE 39]
MRSSMALTCNLPFTQWQRFRQRSHPHHRDARAALAPCPIVQPPSES